jgi:hypothetical protein
MPTHLRRAAEAAGARAAEQGSNDLQQGDFGDHQAQYAIPPPSRVLLTVPQLAHQQLGNVQPR